jgi:hypothetical protein
MLKTALSVALLSTGTVLLSCVSNLANALTFQTYNDRASFLSIINGTTTKENFNSFTTDTPFDNNSIAAGSLILSSNTSGSFFNKASIDVKPYSSFGVVGIDNTPLLNINGLQLDQKVTIKLPGLFSAFGFDFENYFFEGKGASIIISGQTVGTITPTEGTKGFFGVVATDGSFDQVIFKGDNEVFEGESVPGTFNTIDNVEYGNVAPPDVEPVPEPSALLGLAIFGVTATLRKRKERALKC